MDYQNNNNEQHPHEQHFGQGVRQPGMQQHNTESNTPKNQFQGKTITLPMSLFNFLCKEEKERKTNNKMTKMQAFYDLLTKQQIANTLCDIEWINRSAKQLAAEWHWNRITVSSFIQRLVNEQVAKQVVYNGKNIVLLINIDTLDDNIQNMLQESNNAHSPEPSRKNAQNPASDPSPSL